jgi:hypothetical protein
VADFVAGGFVVVRYREDDAIFLDWTEPPKAYAVRPTRLPFVELWDESTLPVPVSTVVLLPFENQIVYDGWIGVKNITFGGSLSADIDDEYAYQWATVQLVGNAVPIALDARPVRRGGSWKEIVEDLLDFAEGPFTSTTS